jgi:hypothetical protein
MSSQVPGPQPPSSTARRARTDANLAKIAETAANLPRLEDTVHQLDESNNSMSLDSEAGEIQAYIDAIEQNAHEAAFLPLEQMLEIGGITDEIVVSDSLLKYSPVEGSPMGDPEGHLSS